MRRENSTFKTKFVSEAGSKLRNTDYFAFVELDHCACYCMADGIDQDKQKLSAKLAVEEAIRKFLEKPKFSKSSLLSCLKAANENLKRESKELRLEASFLMVITDYKSMLWGSAGNVRLYHIRNGFVKNRSVDLSLSQNLADAGKIPKDKVKEHEERHNLFCYLGMPERFSPVCSGKIKLEDSDTLILCTKGIWENAGKPEFLDALEDAKEPEEVCDGIEELILNRQKKNLPSYTLTCIFAEKVYQNPENRAKRVKQILMVTIPVFIVILTLSITLYILHRNNQKKINSMLELKEEGIAYIEEDNYKRALEKFEEAIKAAKSAKIKKNSQAAKEKEELEQYDKLSELMVDAKEAVDNQDYEQSLHYYDLALEQTKELLDFSDSDEEYVKEQRNLAYSYLEILKYIQNGDNMASVDNYAGAIEAYEDALDLAGEIYYVEGKDEASEKLEDIKAKQNSQSQDELIEEADEYVEKAEKSSQEGDTEKAVDYYEKAVDLYKQGGDKEKAKEVKNAMEEMEEAADLQEKEQLKAEAEVSVQKGDTAYGEGDYDSALTYYQKAIDAYTEAADTQSIPAVESKMELAESKNTSTAKEEQQAKKYIDAAEDYKAIKDYDSAAVLYTLAKSIYQELDKQSQVEYMNKLIAEVKNLKELEEPAESGTKTADQTDTQSAEETNSGEESSE